MLRKNPFAQSCAGLLAALVVVAGMVLPAPVVAAPDDASVDQAIDRALGDHAKYQIAVVALKKAVANHDAAEVAALVDYPLRVIIGGKTRHIRTAKEFVARYAQIMTPAIQKAVADQRYADLFVNGEGIMFGRGELWLHGICKDTQCAQFDVKIFTIQDTTNLDDQKTH